jgi:alpha-tubulin suppressor-like RCC1 family protein
MPTPSEIQTCIDNLTTSSKPIDFTLLAAEASRANTGISFSVATVNDLPDLGTNDISLGQIVFVESIGVPVINVQTEWKGLDGRVLRKDFIANRVFGWGYNNCGRLGDGTTSNRCSPVREASFSTDWCGVSTGDRHTAAIKTSGQIWAWGFNLFGQLGDGTVVDKCRPTRETSSSTDWCRVSAGNCHTAAIKTSGQLWAWGLNGCGRLGDGTGTSRCSPVREICSATDWCQVSAGCYHTAAIKTSGQLWAWGINRCGRLGDGTITDRCSPVRERCSATDWCQVSAGFYHTAARKTSGQIWVWGNNSNGRLGDGTTTDRCSPVRERCSATDWCGVSAGGRHTAAIKTSGQIWAWGRNDIGQLGDGTVVDKCSPVREFCSATDWCGVSAGTCHIAAIKTSGQIWSWGLNNGRLGNGVAAASRSPVREICSATDWCQVSAGGCHTTAISVR